MPVSAFIITMLYGHINTCQTLQHAAVAAAATSNSPYPMGTGYSAAGVTNVIDTWVVLWHKTCMMHVSQCPHQHCQLQQSHPIRILIIMTI